MKSSAYRIEPLPSQKPCAVASLNKAEQLVRSAGAASLTVERVITQHSHSAAKAQAVLRLGIVVLVATELAVLSDVPYSALPLALLGAYGLWACALTVLAWSRRLAVAAASVVLLADLVLLTAVLTSSGGFERRGVGASLLDDAYLLIPPLAAFQIKPRVTALVAIASAASYFFGAGRAVPDNARPSVIVATLYLLAVGAACVLISWIQNARVETITALVQDRSRLLAEAVVIEERERQTLAESLHDGALQSILAARQDLEETREPLSARERGEALERVNSTLREVARQLRATASSLHPTVLEHSGLATAVRALGEAAAQRGKFSLSLDLTEPTPELDAHTKQLLFSAAREALTNVVKHARATRVAVSTVVEGEVVVLSVSDDGRGISTQAMEHSLSQGHIGIASQRLRIESAGGTMAVSRRPNGGTLVTVTLPRDSA
ncbi:sensor histidine kinase [Streptomyces sp. NPDC058272]|uniref:sensor histidine kinase n=1 Tax=Streptomyces sp. NPDC058272 TaxID=3346415 RepID=UPI0036F12878